MRNILLVIIGAYLFLACSEKKKSLQSYYFPLADKVYVYSAQDSTGKEYWVTNMSGDDGLRTRVFNGKKELQQESHESFYSNGVNLESMILDGQSVDIESGFVFPFDQIDSSEVLFYRIKWQSEGDSLLATYELIRNRRWAGFTSCTIFGKEAQCAKFSLSERIISKGDGDIEVETAGEELYAEGVGLVYRRRQISDAFAVEQQLLEVRESTEEFGR